MSFDVGFLLDMTLEIMIYTIEDIKIIMYTILQIPGGERELLSSPIDRVKWGYYQ